MLETARLLGDRRLAEEALERNFLSCKFIRMYFMKTSFPMTRMIDYTFQKPAILKLPKLVTCPLTAITTQSLKGREAVLFLLLKGGNYYSPPPSKGSLEGDGDLP